jgi:hypothetical protein
MGLGFEGLDMSVQPGDIQEMGFAYVYMARKACTVLNGIREHWWSVLAGSPFSFAVTTYLLY